MVDFIGNEVQSADYKAGLSRSDGVGSVNSKAANNDFCVGVISVNSVMYEDLNEIGLNPTDINI